MSPLRPLQPVFSERPSDWDGVLDDYWRAVQFRNLYLPAGKLWKTQYLGQKRTELMWHDFQLLIGRAHAYMAHLDRNEWIVVFIVVIVVGTSCLRGFGSRLGY